MSLAGVTPESRYGFKRHLTFANTYRHYLRSFNELPDDSYLEPKPLLHKLVVHSLRIAFGDDENAKHERKMILERVEGRPAEHKEVTHNLKGLQESPLAKSLKALTAVQEGEGRPKNLLVEPGPDANNPHAGATYEVIQPGDSRYSKNLPDAVLETTESNLVPSVDEVVEADVSHVDPGAAHTERMRAKYMRGK